MAFLVGGGNRLAAGIVVRQVRQPGTENRRLERIEPGVDADAGADITVAPAIFADLPQRDGELRIVGCRHAGIAERSQILCRIEAEAGDVAKATGRSSMIESAMALRAILDDPEAVAAGEAHDPAKGGRLAVKVHRQHGLLPAPLPR